MMETGQIGGHLAELLEAARAAERQLFDGVDPVARDAVPADGGWSVKDLQVHLLVWKARQAERLAQAARGEVNEPLGNNEIDAINAAEHDRHADWSWERVTTAAEAASSDLAARVRSADFSRPAMAAVLSGSLSNGCSHPLEHLFSVTHDEAAEQRLVALEGRLAEVVASGLLPDAVAGGTIYNQACRRAMAGQLESAREMLRTAFRLNPGLLEWAPQDTDVQALWGELESLAPQ
jgi:hypothetical protein